jgi:uncharacterized protein YdeI (YjbR/CyaY-like superfamily)
VAQSKLDQLPRVHVETRAAWRAWLSEHHAEAGGAWFVSWKRATGRPAVPYEEVVEEALCFGWIDSTARTIDDERQMMLMTPRKKGSAWSRSNKQRLERLEAAGLIEPAGYAAIERAKADGSWTILDDVEDLIEPPDLTAALNAESAARRNWDAFTPSARKAILQQIAFAKRPETRARRVAEAARLAAGNQKAFQPQR